MKIYVRTSGIRKICSSQKHLRVVRLRHVGADHLCTSGIFEFLLYLLWEMLDRILYVHLESWWKFISCERCWSSGIFEFLLYLLWEMLDRIIYVHLESWWKFISCERCWSYLCERCWSGSFAYIWNHDEELRAYIWNPNEIYPLIYQPFFWTIFAILVFTFLHAPLTTSSGSPNATERARDLNCSSVSSHFSPGCAFSQSRSCFTIRCFTTFQIEASSTFTSGVYVGCLITFNFGLKDSSTSRAR